MYVSTFTAHGCSYQSLMYITNHKTKSKNLSRVCVQNGILKRQYETLDLQKKFVTQLRRFHFTILLVCIPSILLVLLAFHSDDVFFFCFFFRREKQGFEGIWDWNVDTEKSVFNPVNITTQINSFRLYETNIAWSVALKTSKSLRHFDYSFHCITCSDSSSVYKKIHLKSMSITASESKEKDTAIQQYLPKKEFARKKK